MIGDCVAKKQPKTISPSLITTMPKFSGDNVKALDGFLSKKSYIEGYVTCLNLTVIPLFNELLFLDGLFLLLTPRYSPLLLAPLAP
jgi:hypothetical protein